MTALAVCAAVFAGSAFISWRLSRFIADCDRREAELLAVEEAERIVRHTYTTDRSTWPNGGEL